MLALVGEKLEKINLEVDPSSSDRINQIKQVHSRAVKLTENQRRLLSGEPAIEEKSVFKVGALVSEAVESMKTATRFDSITLNAPDGNLEVLADQQKLFGALINLIKNGIESCKARQQKDRDMGNPSVDVTVDGDEDTVKIQVKDNGLGIPPERLDEIFSGESTKESGHGIGLLLAKKTIESYGGTLTAESDGENKGATFTITLPKQKSH
jgi:signal transduction histidine kinase